MVPLHHYLTAANFQHTLKYLFSPPKLECHLATIHLDELVLLLQIAEPNFKTTEILIRLRTNITEKKIKTVNFSKVVTSINLSPLGLFRFMFIPFSKLGGVIIQ